MVMRLFILQVTFFLSITSFTFSKIYYTGNETVVVTGNLDGKNSFISYVTINGCNYIIKQKKVTTKLMAMVRDALGAYIAKDLGIAPSAQIIEAKENIPGKVYPQLPAILQTLAHGKTVREQPESKYYKLSLKQRSPEDDQLVGRWLTETIINQMTWHKQLPIIIALDLFISNTDRHSGNLFYDPTTDSFCAIDMDCIFRCDIPAFACKKLDLMVNVYKKQFTIEEIEALTIVRDTLTFLLKKYTPKKIIAQLHVFVRQVECTKMVKKIAELEEMIIKNRASVRKLIVVLDKIINDFHQ